MDRDPIDLALFETPRHGWPRLRPLEQRRLPRVRLASYLRPPSPTVLDLSAGGAFVTLDPPLPSGTLCTLDLTFDRDLCARVCGLSRWRRGPGERGPSGNGFQFLALDARQAALIGQVRDAIPCRVEPRLEISHRFGGGVDAPRGYLDVRLRGQLAPVARLLVRHLAARFEAAGHCDLLLDASCYEMAVDPGAQAAFAACLARLARHARGRCAIVLPSSGIASVQLTRYVQSAGFPDHTLCTVLRSHAFDHLCATVGAA